MTLRRLALPLFVAAVALLAAAPAGAQIAWATMSHDFGTIQEGEHATFVFTFTNESDAPITLLEVRASCGCTTPSYTTEPVAPGEEGAITVVYNSQGRPGVFEKTVFVSATGGDPHGYELHINGRVVPAEVEHFVAQGNVRFDTDEHDALTVASAEPMTHTFRMQNAGTRPIRIRGARTFGEGMEVAFPDRPVFPGEVAEITVTAPAPTGGTFDMAVVLDTDDTVQPAKSLRIRGRVAGS